MILLIMYGGYKRAWVWGWLYDETCEDHEKIIAKLEDQVKDWRSLALDNIKISTRAADEADRLRSERDELRRSIQEGADNRSGDNSTSGRQHMRTKSD